MLHPPGAVFGQRHQERLHGGVPPQHRVILANKHHNDLLLKAEITLEDVADVVTGFYSGDNTRFIRALNGSVKGGKNYQTVPSDKIRSCLSIQGVCEAEAYIPYVKGSSERRYIRKIDEWFVRWDLQTIAYYQNDKKARFKNSNYYFKTGVAIPMVKASTIKATLIKQRVFDQSIVGIFPKNPDHLYYILALMNSNIINELIHIINPTANNSANYVKMLPYIQPSLEQLIEINQLVSSVISYEEKGQIKQADLIHNSIDEKNTSIYSQKCAVSG